MFKELDYVVLPGLGAAKGAQRFVFDQPETQNELGCVFAYGSNESELAESIDALNDRSGLARDFPESRSYLDGLSMSQRYLIVSVITELGLPGRIVDVEFYPPYDDENINDEMRSNAIIYMELADILDNEKMNKILGALGLR
jgi:hypothetical protein